MSVLKNNNSAFEEISELNKYKDGAWTSCECAEAYKNGAWEDVWSRAIYLLKDGVLNTNLLTSNKFEVYDNDDSKLVTPKGTCSISTLSRVYCYGPEYNSYWGYYVIAKHLYTEKTFTVPSNATKLFIEGVGTNTASVMNGSNFFINTGYNDYGYVSSEEINQNGDFSVSIDVSSFVGKNVYLLFKPYVMTSNSSVIMDITINNIYFK